MIVDLKNQVSLMSNQVSLEYKGQLDDLQVERVIERQGTTGLDMTVTDSRGDTVVTFKYPTRIMIYTWKGQRLAIPVYDATAITYP